MPAQPVLPAWFDDRVWTPDELSALVTGEGRRRFEIVDGVLVVSPHADRPHESIIGGLLTALRTAAPPDAEAVSAAMIDVHPTYRLSDVAVLSRAAYERPEAAVSGGGVLLVVEVESPSSRTTDRISKRAEYAVAWHR